MSNEIDKRIVEMEFRNKKFQENAEQTIKTLDKLDSSLDFNSGVGKSLDVIASKFTNMGMIGQGVLQNLATDAYNLGKNLVKSLTVDQIGAGFSEYELKMGSIQTIMSSTGESLDVVSGKLEELNKYADKTIYSFGDMQQNVSKFTNAGIDLTPAVEAIKGIANLTALSGGNAQQASHAMYNFSQAMSAGYMSLLDWKSIAQVANIGTVEFRNELIKTALDMGTLVKQGDKYVSTTTDLNGNISDAFEATKGFENSLKSQWLTAEVLTKVLNEYGDETTDLGKKAFKAATEVKSFSHLLGSLRESAGSGWAETMEAIFGNYDEAVELWTNLFNRISGWMDASAKRRNDVLTAWKGFGGRDAMIESFKNILTVLESLTKPISMALNKLFEYNKGWTYIKDGLETINLGPIGNTIYESMVRASKGIQKFTEALIPSEETIEKISDVLLGLFSLVSFAIDLLKPVGAVVFGIIKALSPLFKILLSILSLIGRITSRMVAAAKKSPAIQQAIKMITNAFQYLYEKIDAFANKAVKVIDGFMVQNEDIFANIEKAISEFNLDGLETIVSKIGAFFKRIIEAFETKKLENAFTNVATDANRALGVSFGGIIETIYDFIEKIFSFDFETLLDIGVTSGIMAGIVRIVKGVRSFDKVIKGATGVMDSIGEIGETSAKIVKQSLKSIKIFTKGFGDALSSLALDLKAKAFLTISAAITLLIGGLYLLTKLDTEKVNNSVRVILLICGGLALVALAVGKAGSMLMQGDKVFSRALTSFGKNTSKTLNAAGAAMTSGFEHFSTAFNSTVDAAGNSAKAVFGTFSMMFRGAVDTAINSVKLAVASFSSVFSAAATAIKFAGAALMIASIGLLFLEIAAAIAVLSKIDSQNLQTTVKGLGLAFAALAAILAALAYGFKKINESKDINAKSLLRIFGVFTTLSYSVASMGTAMAILGAGLLVLKSVGAKSMAESMAIIVSVIAAFVYMGDNLKKVSKNLPGLATSLTFFALNVAVISKLIGFMIGPIKALSEIPIESLGSVFLSLFGLVSLMLLVGNAQKLLKQATGEMGDLTIVFLALSGALYTFADIMTPLSKLSWGDLGKGFTFIAATLGIAVGFFVLVGKLSSKIKAGTKLMIPFVFGVLGLTAALNLMLVPLSAFAKIKFSDLIAGLTAMGITLGGLIGSLLILGGLEKIAKKGLSIFPALAGSIALMATAMSLLSVPVFLLGNLKTETLSRGILALGSAFVVAASGMIIMSLAAKLIGNSAGNLAKFGIAFAALAAAVTVISIVAPIIIKNADLITEAVKILIGSVVTAIEETADAIINEVLDLIVDVLDAVIKYLPKVLIQLEVVIVEILDWLISALPDFVDRIAQTIAVMFKELGKAINKYVGKEDALMALGSIEFVYILIKQLASLKDKVKDAIPSVILIASLFAILVAAFGVMNYLGIDGEHMKNQSIAISIVVLSLKPLLEAITKFGSEADSVQWKAIAKALAFVSATIFAVGGVFLILDKLGLNGDNTIKMSMGISLAILALTPLTEAFGNAAESLGDVDVKSLFGFAGSLGMLVAVIGGVFLALDKLRLDPTYLMEYAKGIAAAMTGLVPLVVSIGLITALLGALHLNAAVVLKVGVAIIAVVTVAMAVLAALMALLGGINELSGGGFKKLLEEAVEIFGLMGEAIGVFVGSLVGGIGEGVLITLGKGLGSFAESAQPFFDLVNSLDDSFGDRIGSLTGGIMTLAGAGFLNALSDLMTFITGKSSLTKLGESLSEFAPYIDDFLNSFGNVSADKAEAIKYAAEAISALSNAAPKEGGVVQWWSGTTDFSGITANLASLGSGLVAFQESTKGLKEEAIEKTKKAAEMLKILMEAIPKTGGIVQDWEGEADFASFAANLPLLGSGLKGFNDAVTDASGNSTLSTDSISVATNAADMIAALNDHLPPSGGWAQKIGGEKDLDKFIEQLPKLGRAIVKFNKIVTRNGGIDSEASTRATRVARAAANVANSLPETGGWSQKISGEKNLETFASNLPKLATGIVAFDKVISDAGGINADVSTSAVSVAQACAKLYEYLPDSEGFGAWAKGFPDLGGFGDDMTPLGTGIANFAASVKGIDTSGVATAVTAMESIANLQNILDEETLGFLFEVFGDTTIVSKLGLFAANLPILGEGVTAFSAKVNGIDPVKMDSATNAITTLVDLVGISRKLEDFSLEAFNDAIQAINFDTFNANLDNISKDLPGLNGLREKFITLGKEMIKALGEGLKASAEGDTSPVIDGIKEAYNKMGNYLNNLATIDAKTGGLAYSAGTNVLKGLNNGLNDWDAFIELCATADSVMKTVITRMEKVADIESPSKVTAEDGRYLLLGLAKGMKDNTRVATNSATVVTDEVMTTLQNGMNTISKRLGDPDFDMSPTITPVVDMSNVRLSAQEADDLFNSKRLSLNANVGSASLDMARSVKMEVSSVSNGDISRAKMLEMMSKIGQKLDDMENKLGDMSMVLDTGELVGAITPSMMRSMDKRRVKIARGVVSSRSR